MKQPGRPSKWEEDREPLLHMIELWRCGMSGLLVRKLARIVVGLEDASTAAWPQREPKRGKPNAENQCEPNAEEAKLRKLESDAKLRKLESVAERLRGRFREFKISG